MVREGASMVLNFGFKNQLFSRTAEDDGQVFFRNLLFAEGTSAPTLNNKGDVVFWEKAGVGTYDVYNSSIDGTKWTTSTTGGESLVEESATFIRCAIERDATEDTANTASIETKAMLTLGEITEVEFRAELGRTGSTSVVPSPTTQLWVWGLKIKEVEDNATDDSVWTIKKIENGTWDVYDDDVFQENIDPLDNVIKTNVSNTSVPGTNSAVHIQGKLYEIKSDGGTYMLIRNSKQTFIIQLEPLQ